MIIRSVLINLPVFDGMQQINVHLTILHKVLAKTEKSSVSSVLENVVWQT